MIPFEIHDALETNATAIAYTGLVAALAAFFSYIHLHKHKELPKIIMDAIAWIGIVGLLIYFGVGLYFNVV